MRDEGAGGDRAAVSRGTHHRHLRYGLVGDVAEVHQRAAGQPDRLQPRLQALIRVQRRAVFLSADPHIGGGEDHAGHSVVDHRYGDAFDLIFRITGRQQCAAARPCRIAEGEGDRRGGARHPVDDRVPVIGGRAVWRLHRRGGDLAGVLHVDRHRRFGARRPDQSAFDGERPHPGEDIAAVLAVGDQRPVDRDLKEEVIHIDAWPFRPFHHRDLGGQRVRPAHAVDLARVGRSHHAHQKTVPVGGQVFGQKIPALRRAAAHPHAADAVRHISGPFRPAARACHRCRGQAPPPQSGGAFLLLTPAAPPPFPIRLRRLRASRRKPRRHPRR